MTIRPRTRYVAISAVLAMTATGISALVPRNILNSWTDPLALIRHQSPGPRSAGAILNKLRQKPSPRRAVARAVPAHVVPHHAVRQVRVAAHRPKPVSAVLPTYVQGPLAIGPANVPVAVQSLPLPEAFVPVLAGAGPAANSGGTALLATLPIGIAIASTGGGGGGGGGSSGFGPSAPEPATWLMMILGFGFLGTMIRKRRRAELCLQPSADSELSAASIT